MSALDGVIVELVFLRLYNAELYGFRQRTRPFSKDVLSCFTETDLHVGFSLVVAFRIIKSKKHTLHSDTQSKAGSPRPPQTHTTL